MSDPAVLVAPQARHAEVERLIAAAGQARNDVLDRQPTFKGPAPHAVATSISLEESIDEERTTAPVGADPLGAFEFGPAEGLVKGQPTRLGSRENRRRRPTFASLLLVEFLPGGGERELERFVRAHR